MVSDYSEAFVDVTMPTFEALKAHISSVFPGLADGWRLIRNDRKFVNIDSLQHNDVLVIEQQPAVDAEYRKFWDHLQTRGPSVSDPKQLIPIGPRDIVIKDMLPPVCQSYVIRVHGHECERDLRQSLEALGCAGNKKVGSFLMYKQKDISHPLLATVCVDDFGLLDGSTVFLLQHVVPGGLPGGARKA